jgi:hypothetical protein
LHEFVPNTGARSADGVGLLVVRVAAVLLGCLLAMGPALVERSEDLGCLAGLPFAESHRIDQVVDSTSAF